MATLNFDDPASVLASCEALCYYFNLRLISRKTGKDPKLPENIQKIIDLAEDLTKPDLTDWSHQANGKLPGKPKPKPATENGDGEPKKARGQWTEEKKQELVRLVEDEDFRKEKLGGNGTLVWAVMARHFGFAKANPLQKQYSLMTGKDPPGMRKREGDAPSTAAAKKPKVEAAAAPPTGTGADGWTSAQEEVLKKLVQDQDYRKMITGKSHIKWSRIAEHLDKGKKETKKKYCALAGISMDALENLH